MSVIRNDEDRASEVPRVMAQRLDRRDQSADLGLVHPDVGEHLAIECRRRILDCRAAEVGDLDQGGAAVGGVGEASDQLCFLESSNRVGDARDVYLETVACLGDGQRAVARERQKA